MADLIAVGVAQHDPRSGVRDPSRSGGVGPAVIVQHDVIVGVVQANAIQGVAADHVPFGQLVGPYGVVMRTVLHHHTGGLNAHCRRTGDIGPDVGMSNGVVSRICSIYHHTAARVSADHVGFIPPPWIAK